MTVDSGWIAILAEGTTWVGGRAYISASSPRGIVSSLNSSNGSVNLSKIYDKSSIQYSEVDFITTNNSGQPIIGTTYGQGYVESGRFGCTLECWDSSLTTRQWGLDIVNPNPTTNQHTTDVVAGWYDTNSGNTYMTGYYNNSPERNVWAYLICVNSSGVVQWQKTANNPLGNATVEISGIYADSTGVYWSVSFYDTRQQPNKPHIVVKFNSSGSVQWQRGFGRATVDGMDIWPGSVTCVGNIMYLGGTAYVGNYAPYNVKLPNDGSFTGTYGAWRYYATDISIADGDLLITNITGTTTRWDSYGSISTETRTSVGSTFTPTVTRTDIP